ncbi:hypothetical protein PT974_08433 [Cladobotryum mycophilum]|uniref:Pinin/SDK/MemA protein domain-containing protein n=1 Tax=Cladobotryum mycophilum TaxID=491253 RepID=A0ABR0SEA9_9HYPO
MATATESVALAEQPSKLDDLENEADMSGVEDTGLKRKASDVNDDDDDEHDSPKRVRYDDSHEAAAESPRRSSSPSRSRMQEVTSNVHQERRIQAAQEEKKRGKRLFGGLMSTLNQTSTTTTTQQKRRQEIERRQQERIQKQRDEDDQKRTQKLARLKDVRMTEQISFEEAVMRNKHSKRLAMARFLQTRSEPRIYFLPWKPTPQQEDVIDEQISRAKKTIAREAEQFRVRKQRHIERYGPPRHRSVTPDLPAAAMRLESSGSISHATKAPENEQPPPTEDMNHDQHDQNDQHDQHDESGDVLVEAEEDMVIY